MAVTGPGWTDELARIFDPRTAGPKWQQNLGYRGRPRLRLLLDGEDMVHSYAKAAYEKTGKWTGPLTMGLEEAFSYGAWGGGAPEPNPLRRPEDPQMEPPEILTFVAMPADLIEAVAAGSVCDGYPEDTRKQLGRCLEGLDGYFINAWVRQLQDEDRLITWSRPARLPGCVTRPNALISQKYYREGQPIDFKALRSPPVLLSQVMGAGTSLKVGDMVEGLKNGRLVQGKWIPSQWSQAEVLAVNYDGTYDLQFRMNFGPYREQRLKGLRGNGATLSLRRNEIYADFGADTMPAKFRMMQELNYAQAVSPDRIRLPGSLDRLADTTDTESNQDWYLCTSRLFTLTASAKTHEKARLEEFVRKFQLGYHWVPTADGLRFEPVPNQTMASALRANHNDVAQQFAIAAQADEEARRKLDRYKAGMEKFEAQLEQIPKVAPAAPSRPAGPRGRGLYAGTGAQQVPRRGQPSTP